jgi:hypothetical protein
MKGVVEGRRTTEKNSKKFMFQNSTLMAAIFLEKLTGIINK